MNVYISQEEFDDFMCEEDTSPYTRLDVAQRELDRAESVAQFVGRAEVLGYSTAPPKKWNKIEVEMDGVMVHVDALVQDNSFLIGVMS